MKILLLKMEDGIFKCKISNSLKHHEWNWDILSVTLIKNITDEIDNGY